MGTGKSGRYLRTIGAKNGASEYAVVHGDEGTYTKPSKPTDKLRLASGGHGQKNIELLNKYNIEYRINKTYPNGVRIGDVPNHKNTKKQLGSNQTWFPKEWSTQKIKKAGEYVLNLKKNVNAKDGQVITGIYDGVKVGVIKTKGVLSTIFPDKDQSEALKRRNKK